MTSADGATTSIDTLSDIFAGAMQNMRHSGDIVIAATQIVAKRVGLGLAATFDPLQADHVEFAQIVPEKVKAFSAAGLAVLKQSDQANRQMMRLASDEVILAGRATMEMTVCSNPASLAEAQGRFAHAWFDRAAANFITMGRLALTVQVAAMAPIQQTVLANAERLGR